MYIIEGEVGVKMIFDMHCHTSEGSPDAIVSLEKTIRKLKLKGYDGMLVSDHNSYKGYKSLSGNYGDFKVLRGVEYDSLNGGHILIILPSRIQYDIFEYRGMEVEDVVKIVHALGGILGPAHPYDYFKLGICNTKYKDNLDFLSEFDFIETFNGCLNNKGAILSGHLAKELNKPCFGGSDSHSLLKVGLGRTIINEDIRSEDDLIECVKSANFESFKATGEFYERKHEILHSMGVVTGGFAYGVVNRCLSYNHKKKARIILNALGVEG